MRCSIDVSWSSDVSTGSSCLPLSSIRPCSCVASSREPLSSDVIASSRCGQLVEQLVAVGEQLLHLGVAVDQRLRHLAGVGQQVRQLLCRARRSCPTASTARTARPSRPAACWRRSARSCRSSAPAAWCRCCRRSATARGTRRARRRGPSCGRAGSPCPGSASPAPCGSSDRYFWPSSVLILIAAPVRSPSQASLTLNDTLTDAPSSWMSLTLPTLTPAIRTSLSFCSPEASLNSARVGGAAADHRQVVGVQRGDEAQRQDGDADQRDRDGVALLEGLHPVHLARFTGSSGQRHVGESSGGKLTRPGELAGVEVEPGAVVRGAGQRAHLGRQELDEVLQLRLVLVELVR